MCFPVIALMNTQCLKYKNPKIIKKFELMYPQHKGKLIFYLITFK